MRPLDSITIHIHDLGRGEYREEAACLLCERYLGEIASHAERKLRSRAAERSVGDAEDAALHALYKMMYGIERGRLQLAGRDDLRQLLLWATRCALINNLKPHPAETVGGDPFRVEAATYGRDHDRPEIRVEAEDGCRSLFDLVDDELRRLALLKRVGYTNLEIVRELGWSQAKVEGKLDRIRKRWARFAPHEPSRGGRGQAPDLGGLAGELGGAITILHELEGWPHPSANGLDLVPPTPPIVGDWSGGQS